MIFKDQQLKRPNLKLIYGGIHFEMSLDGCRLVAAPKDNPPFSVEARVAEEDTFLVLSADPVVEEPRESLETMIEQINEVKPEVPGSVLVRRRRNSPLEFLAIVHDLDLEPSWKEEWISGALDRVFREVAERKVRSIALPLLGTTHNSLAAERAATLLGGVMRQGLPEGLQHIWLILPSGTRRKDLEDIESILKANDTDDENG